MVLYERKAIIMLKNLFNHFKKNSTKKETIKESVKEPEYDFKSNMTIKFKNQKTGEITIIDAFDFDKFNEMMSNKDLALVLG